MPGCIGALRWGGSTGRGDRDFMRHIFRNAMCGVLLGVLLFLSFKPASAILAMVRLAETRGNGTSEEDDRLVPKWRDVRPTRQQLNDTPRRTRMLQRRADRHPGIVPTVLARLAPDALRLPDRPRPAADDESATPAYLKTYRPGRTNSSLAPPA